MATTITKKDAELISELLCNAGWIDDADELLFDMLDNGGEKLAKEQAKRVDTLIAKINPFLPKRDRLDVRVVELLKEISEDNE